MAPSKVNPRIRRIVRSTYGAVAVIYTTWHAETGSLLTFGNKCVADDTDNDYNNDDDDVDDDCDDYYDDDYIDDYDEMIVAVTMIM